MITRHYIECLPSDPILAAKQVCSDYFKLESEKQKRAAAATLKLVGLLLDGHDSGLTPLLDLDDFVQFQKADAIINEIQAARSYLGTLAEQDALRADALKDG